jgi:hypothetical protein
MSRSVSSKRLDDEASAGWTTYGTSHVGFGHRRSEWSSWTVTIEIIVGIPLSTLTLSKT